MHTGGNDGSFRTLWELTEMECQAECLAVADCVAFEYGGTKLRYKACELHVDRVCVLPHPIA